MNAKTLIAAAALSAAAFPVFAEQTYADVDSSGSQSPKSREQVTQELKAAEANPDYAIGGHEYVDPAANFASSETHQQVRQELKAAEANPDYAIGGHEYVDPTANFASSETRAQVKRELQQSEADGSYALEHQEYDGQDVEANAQHETNVQHAANGYASNSN